VSASTKKAYGQHFLTDPNILRVVERLAELGPDDVVLEIGAGRGVLTEFLADRVSFVHAVEIDRDLEPQLHALLGGRENVHIVFGDALRLDLAGLDPPAGKLVANLPYNVATPLIVESLAGLPSVQHWCVMVQREVADRLFAAPGTKAYGAVSVLVQLSTHRTGFHPVARTVFRPPPNVDSALVAFSRIPPPPAFAEIVRVVEGAFSHRRKTLANALRLSGVAEREAVVDALAELRKPADTRAEALVPGDFATLTELLS
jgi:16S rRNA (adenine1518-N6/adenine1519-N6)-dimethyltransferase